MQEILRTEGLTKSFRLSPKQRRLLKTDEKVRTAVKDLSFSVNQGEIFGLLGPNGAGKTTTLRMLATLISPDSGDAVVDGASIVREPEKVRAKIGFLTGELKLEDFFTPNYIFDFFSALHGVPEEIGRARKQELFERFGILDFAEVKIANLSTGMKQKTSLVVSLAHDPDIVVFDEPTNGLDVITARTVTDFLVELRERGKTVVLSTHIFSLAERVCDRVGLLINGKLTACDTLNAVCDGKSLEDRFFDLYAATVKEER